MPTVLDDGPNNFSGGPKGEEIEALGGNDSIAGQGGDDTLLGGDGADTLDGGQGSDLVRGGFQIPFSTASDQLYGGDGNDTISAEGSYADMFGGAGNDIITGVLFGSVEGGAGADRLTGTGGFIGSDLSYESSDGGVTIDLATNAASGGDAQGDIIRKFADVIGSAFGDRLRGAADDNILSGLAGADDLLGRDGADVLKGGDANDTLKGGAGNDTLSGGEGKDRIDGGDGVDTLDFSDEAVAVTINLTTGKGGGAAAGDRFIGIENLKGGLGADRLVGSIAAEILDGGQGDDTLEGGDDADRLTGFSGDDEIDGGQGNDTLAGGAGADHLDGGAGIDTLDLTTFFQVDSHVVDLAKGEGSGGDLEGDTYRNFENVTGSFYKDEITGDDGGNSLSGGSGGDDVLKGGSGADTLAGGSGADTLNGGGGLDLADYSSGFGAVKVDLAKGRGTGNNAEGDRLTAIEQVRAGFGNDTLIGSKRDETLDGSFDHDSISGGGGADTLIGGSGKDTLAGDGGRDVFDYDFSFHSFGDTADLIEGFKKGEDRIDLSDIDAKAGPDGVQRFSFIGGREFTAEGQIRIEAGEKGQTLVEVNTSGLSGADMLIELDADLVLSGKDFILI
jgi:Ca2+-binding RTX toxin-like protein